MIDPLQLRRAFGKFMTGITVITTTLEDGTPIGITANSFTSVSMEPPLLLICLAKSLNSYPVYEKTSHFAVNILSHRQKNVSQIFARPSIDDRFAKIKWKSDSFNNPVIDYTVAHFSCSVYDKKDAGDHLILIGKIEDFTDSSRMGLGYYNGSYFNISMERKIAELRLPPSNTDKPLTKYYVGAIIKKDNHIWLLKDADGSFKLPYVVQDCYSGILDKLINKIGEYGLQCNLETVYSIYNTEQDNKHFIYYSASIAKISEEEMPQQEGHWISLDNLKQIKFENKAISIMLNRYAEEEETGITGLYLGDEQNGQVHQQNFIKERKNQ